MAFLEFTRSADGVKMSINQAFILAAAPMADGGTVLHVTDISPSITVVEDYATVLEMLADKGPGGGPAT